MKVFIVFAHPEPKSFNGALLLHAVETLEAAGHEVVVSDLHAMGWNPVSDRANFTTVANADYLKLQDEEIHASKNDGFAADVKAEMEKLFWCDFLILQFPLWWFGLPAIMKGWADRVLACGVAYGGGKWYDRGVFSGKKAMLSLTTGGPSTSFSSDGLSGEINALLNPINHGILRFCGFDVLPPYVVWAPARIGDDGRQEYLDAFSARLQAIETTEAIRYPSLDDYEPKTFVLKKDSVD